MLAIGFLAELMIALHIQREHAYSIAEKTASHDKEKSER
jgi:hypothetical protein